MLPLASISIDDAHRVLSERGWSVGDIGLQDSHGPTWIVFCYRKNEGFTVKGRTQTAAWNKAVLVVVAPDN